MEKETRSRTDKVIKNGILNSIAYLVTVIMGMYCQRVFILEMGYNLYGLNAMFTTIVSTLSVTELGFGTAIVFSLYKPLAMKDDRKVGTLISLYRRVYMVVGGIIIVGSCVLIPFIPKLTGFAITGFLPAYLIFVANVALTYLFTFNQTILNADQKNYIVSIENCAVRTIYNILQIGVIYLTHSFVLYTATNMVCGLAGNIILNRIVAKQYPYLKQYRKEKLPRQEVDVIKSKVFALIYHKVGGYLVSGGNNFILSAFLGVATVGYYSNYIFVTNTLKSLIGSVFAGFMSGFGNLHATEKSERSLQVFKRARFVYFVLYAVTSAGFFCSIEPFLRCIYTDETVLPHLVSLMIVLNYYIYGYSACYGDYRAAAGVFEPDRYLGIVVPILSVVISIALVKPLGVAGVLFGTFICYVVKECTVVPYICGKYVFHCGSGQFIIRLWADTLFVLLTCFTADKACGLLHNNSLFISFIINGGVSVTIACLMIVLIYGRTDEFHYVADILIKKLILKINNKSMRMFQ